MIVDSKSKHQKGFFCRNLGPTVEVLAFFNYHHRVRSLLKRLSKRTSAYYDAKQQHFFRECKPTIFSAKIEHLPPYKSLSDRFVQKILHVKDDLFVIQYIGGLIELRDLST